MANVDVDNIVAHLRQTSKGRLKYDTQNWNEVFLETTSSPGIHVSSFVVRNISKLASTSFENSQEEKQCNVGIHT